MHATASEDQLQGPVTTRLLVHFQNVKAARDERGAEMTEYALLISFVALLVMIVLFSFGDTLKSTFGLANEAFDKSPVLNTNGSGTN